MCWHICQKFFLWNKEILRNHFSADFERVKTRDKTNRNKFCKIKANILLQSNDNFCNWRKLRNLVTRYSSYYHPLRQFHIRFHIWSGNFIYEMRNFIYEMRNFIYEMCNFIYEIENFIYEIENYIYWIKNFIYGFDISYMKLDISYMDSKFDIWNYTFHI